jgi:eukaryotic-like serine/threonine-protein kinase
VQPDATPLREADRLPPPPANGTAVQDHSARDHAKDLSHELHADGYRVLELLGEGTFGQVWLAEEEHSGTRVAVKFFARRAGRQWHTLLEEVRQLASLDGVGGIVQLKGVAPSHDPPYFVMSYAECGSLAARLQRGPLPPAEALRIFAAVAAALAEVHAKGIRHCDLKPANVLLDAAGRPLLADFGQAHLDNDDTPSLGTFFYMAPEQATLDPQLADARWDVYALGALFHAMLTGHPPRQSPSLSAAIEKEPDLAGRLRVYRLGVRAAPPATEHRKIRGLDRPLADLIDRCLAIDPAERPRDAGAVAAATGC